MIDILIIVFVVAIVGVFFLRKSDDKYSSFSGERDMNLTDMSLTYKTTGVRNFTVDALKVGDTLFDYDSGVKLGIVTDINTKPSKELIVKNNGEAVEAVRGGYFDLYITIDSKVYESDSKYLANGSFDLKINSDVKVSTRKVLISSRLVNFGAYSEEL